MVFPMSDLKSQVFAMYQRPGFEQNLTKWAHRHVDENTFADIYDRKIWKTFPSSDGLKGSLFLCQNLQIQTLELLSISIGFSHSILQCTALE